MSEPDARCPVCTQRLEDPHDIVVCARCHQSLHAGEPPAIRVTAEFPAVAPRTGSRPDRPARDRRRPRSPTIPADFTCSWCGKPGDAVRKLLTQGAARICNECVSLCATILQAELGDGWRDEGG